MRANSLRMSGVGLRGRRRRLQRASVPDVVNSRSKLWHWSARHFDTTMERRVSGRIPPSAHRQASGFPKSASSAARDQSDVLRVMALELVPPSSAIRLEEVVFTFLVRQLDSLGRGELPVRNRGKHGPRRSCRRRIDKPSDSDYQTRTRFSPRRENATQLPPNRHLPMCVPRELRTLR